MRSKDQRTKYVALKFWGSSQSIPNSKPTCALLSESGEPPRASRQNMSGPRGLMPLNRSAWLQNPEPKPRKTLKPENRTAKPEKALKLSGDPLPLQVAEGLPPRGERRGRSGGLSARSFQGNSLETPISLNKVIFGIPDVFYGIFLN